MALLDNIPGWKVFSAGIGLAALALVGYFAWVWFVKGPDDLKELQNQAAEHALDQVAEEYRKQVLDRGEIRLIVMPVRSDTSNGQIRDMLIKRLNAVEGVKADVPRNPTLEERASGVIRSLLDKDETPPDPAAVFEDAAEADEVLSVKVEKLWSGADSGICTLEVIRIVGKQKEEGREARIEAAVYYKGLSGSARPGDEPDDSGPGFGSALLGFLWRLVVVLAATAIMPFLSWPAAKAAFRQDSNAMNAGLLFVLTALDLLVLFALVAFEFSTTAIVCAVLLLPVALIWNLRMLNFIEER
ncbi:MAG: hypothetical protein H6841_04160 [Planctomycetes bacterium]|nr:hypothetical protein [Planctomycetota bacterium]MCB9934570.1 hypothetical protein [Planctomycetota bacterium]